MTAAAPTKKQRLYIEWHHDWDSLFFWQEMNWRDFTWIYLATEWDKSTSRFALSAGLLGVKCELQYVYNDHSPTLVHLRTLADAHYVRKDQEGAS